jgi:ubiquitin carboxyl-terminal hydrolase 25
MPMVYTNKNNGLTILETLNATNDWFKSLANGDSDLRVDPSTIELLNLKIERLSEELKDATDRQTQLEDQIQRQFSNLQKVGYRCHSIFVHRGQASFGHYWIYINDFKNKVFRKYNDEYVTEVPYREVFDDNEENTATPYFLVFIREDLAESYSEAVVRDVIAYDL